MRAGSVQPAEGKVKGIRERPDLRGERAFPSLLVAGPRELLYRGGCEVRLP